MNEEPAVCYAKGTLILTEQGFVPIEDIKIGHEVVTVGKIKYAKHGIQTDPVIWTSNFKKYKLNSTSRPICITKNALGKNIPFQDLYVSPMHSIFLNGRLALAKYLVNGKTIYQDTKCESVIYYHVELNDHSLIVANGVLAESYLDLNNRYVFENKNSVDQKTKFMILYRSFMIKKQKELKRRTFNLKKMFR
jgi:hypothetical protein